MEDLGAALENTPGLAALLDAAWNAFEVMIATSADYADTDEGFFTAMAYVMAAAANGRDAIIAAPSVSPRPPTEQPFRLGSYRPTGSARAVAASLAVLSAVLADRLGSAASSTDDPQDRIACLNGAQYAREVHALLAGTQP
jgi:hypothetical protein